MDQEAPQEDRDEKAAKAPHLTTTAEPVDYQVVIPTYRRWRSTQEVTKKKRFKDSSQPFILEHTLGFLFREGVPKERVTLFVANEEEMKQYQQALEGSEWFDVRIQVSVPGVRDTRNFIYKFFPADTYVVSLDDDMEGITWKVREGGTSSCCVDLPAGNFIKIIYDAHHRMKEAGAFLWGLSTSQNPRFLVLDDVSTRNGLVNGYLHGFICRPDAAHDLLRRLPDSVEDAEFSVRHFAKDKVVLRYRMYAGVTSPYTNSGGLQSKFHADTGSIRKSEEWCGAQQLHELFPTLIAAPSDSQTCRQYATEVRFISQTGLGIKARKFAVRRLQGLCRFMLPQLKGKGKMGKGKEHIKKKTALVALARLKAFAIRKKPKKEMPPKHSKMPAKRTSNAEPGKGTPAERPLSLLGDDLIRFAANPKKKGTDAHQRYSKYSRAKNIKDLTGNIDLRYDLKAGYLKVVGLDTRPASTECVVEDDAASGAMPGISGRARSVQVRLAEATGKHPGLYLSKESLLPLLQRCPALNGSWSLFAARAGPLAKVSLPCFRILLHWSTTSRLVFAHSRAAELHVALQSLGAKSTAERLREWMSKQELKFNSMSFEGPPPEEFPALDAGKMESKPKNTRKRQRSTMPRAKQSAKQSATKPARSEDGTSTASRLIFPKALPPAESSSQKSEEAGKVSEMVAGAPNEAKVFASDAKKTDPSPPNFGREDPLTTAAPPAPLETVMKENHEETALAAGPRRLDSTGKEAIEHLVSKKRKTETSILSFFPSDPSDSKVNDQAEPARALTSKTSENTEAAVGHHESCGEPLSACESTREGAAPEMPIQSKTNGEDEANPVETKIQPRDHVVLVLGNQRHLQKNLRSMFAGRSGG